MEETIKINIEAEVNPTESEEKVKKAIENLFGNIETNIQPIYKGAKITAQTKSLNTLTNLKNLLRRERIRDAARKELFEGLDRKTLTFYLNKQVAYAGHVSFAKETAESPLGPIKVSITCKNPREVINWLTAKTE
ncbi:MAG: RNA-binding domain-containing protein [Candidatus Bathyarchaeia archaeon]